MSKLTEDMVEARAKTSYFELIQSFNCWGVGVSDISIFRTFERVEVLALSLNKITTLVDLQFCKKLKELYVRGNDIKDLKELCYLQDLPDLRKLLLKENPCEQMNGVLYRPTVLITLPNLTNLDDIEVTQEEIEMAKLDGILLQHPIVRPPSVQQIMPQSSNFLNPTSTSNLNNAPTHSPSLNNGPTPTPNFSDAPTPGPNLVNAPLPTNNIYNAPTPNNNLNNAPTSYNNIYNAPTSTANLYNGPRPSTSTPEPTVNVMSSTQCENIEIAAYGYDNVSSNDNFCPSNYALSQAGFPVRMSSANRFTVPIQANTHVQAVANFPPYYYDSETSIPTPRSPRIHSTVRPLTACPSLTHRPSKDANIVAAIKILIKELVEYESIDLIELELRRRVDEM